MTSAPVFLGMRSELCWAGGTQPPKKPRKGCDLSSGADHNLWYHTYIRTLGPYIYFEVLITTYRKIVLSIPLRC